MLKILSTRNISLDSLYSFKYELSPTFDIEIDEGQFFYKSLEPPSWLTFIAEADWWIQALAGIATLYVTEIIKELTKYTLKSIRKKISSRSADNDPINLFSTNISKLVKNLPPNTDIILALPIPDSYNPTSLKIISSDINDISIQIALFIHHLPKLMRLIDSEKILQKRILGSIYLELQDDASLKISWKDIDFTSHLHVLPLIESV